MHKHWQFVDRSVCGCVCGPMRFRDSQGKAAWAVTLKWWRTKSFNVEVICWRELKEEVRGQGISEWKSKDDAVHHKSLCFFSTLTNCSSMKIGHKSVPNPWISPCLSLVMTITWESVFLLRHKHLGLNITVVGCGTLAVRFVFFVFLVFFGSKTSSGLEKYRCCFFTMWSMA